MKYLKLFNYFSQKVNESGYHDFSGKPRTIETWGLDKEMQQVIKKSEITGRDLEPFWRAIKCCKEIQPGTIEKWGVEEDMKKSIQKSELTGRDLEPFWRATKNLEVLPSNIETPEFDKLADDIKDKIRREGLPKSNLIESSGIDDDMKNVIKKSKLTGRDLEPFWRAINCCNSLESTIK
jgi:hypothetical protein